MNATTKIIRELELQGYRIMNTLHGFVTARRVDKAGKIERIYVDVVTGTQF